jgi:hypothetical protein
LPWPGHRETVGRPTVPAPALRPSR